MAELPARLENPVTVFQTNGGRLAVLTDLLADDGTGRMAPVMAVLEHGDAKRNARLVTAYSRTANSEGYYQKAFRDKEALRFIDTKRVALLPFERTSMIEEVNEGDNNNTIAQSGGDVKPRERWHDPTAGGVPEFTETSLGQELVARAFDAIVGSRVDLLLRPSRYYGSPYESGSRRPQDALLVERLNRDVDVSTPEGFAIMRRLMEMSWCMG